MVEPSSRFKLWGYMAETLQKIEELDQHMGELRSSQIQCLAWLFIRWAALAPLWAMEVWMRYTEVTWCKKTYIYIYMYINEYIQHIMIWPGMIYRLDSLYGFNCPCWAWNYQKPGTTSALGPWSDKWSLCRRMRRWPWPRKNLGWQLQVVNQTLGKKGGDYWWLLQLLQPCRVRVCRCCVVIVPWASGSRNVFKVDSRWSKLRMVAIKFSM